ncbi:MAG TPA: hypothetical protein PKM65_04020 [Spirochaetota bacterium]|nr:hypothetical protein [Spirochaetota bacterium]HNT10751.1 hypothetical protein [Spirochaetota bacterium]HPU88784.1 hypothetical protein [Spirochaetota bacterium]
MKKLLVLSFVAIVAFAFCFAYVGCKQEAPAPVEQPKVDAPAEKPADAKDAIKDAVKGAAKDAAKDAAKKLPGMK